MQIKVVFIIVSAFVNEGQPPLSYESVSDNVQSLPNFCTLVVNAKQVASSVHGVCRQITQPGALSVLPPRLENGAVS
jgi:hypothetical protein